MASVNKMRDVRTGFEFGKKHAEKMPEEMLDRFKDYWRKLGGDYKRIVADIQGPDDIDYEVVLTLLRGNNDEYSYFDEPEDIWLEHLGAETKDYIYNAHFQFGFIRAVAAFEFSKALILSLGNLYSPLPITKVSTPKPQRKDVSPDYDLGQVFGVAYAQNATPAALKRFRKLVEGCRNDLWLTPGENYAGLIVQTMSNCSKPTDKQFQKAWEFLGVDEPSDISTAFGVGFVTAVAEFRPSKVPSERELGFHRNLSRDFPPLG